MKHQEKNLKNNENHTSKRGLGNKRGRKRKALAREMHPWKLNLKTIKKIKG
jgi:hypothetical protein